MTDLNDSLDNLFVGDTGPVRVSPVIDRPAAAQYAADRAAAGYVQNCSRCRGTGQTPWGVCFKCKGAAKKVFKTSPESRAKASVQRADRKAARELSAVEAWKAENRAAAEWLVATAPRWDVAASLLAGLHRYGSSAGARSAGLWFRPMHWHVPNISVHTNRSITMEIPQISRLNGTHPDDLLKDYIHARDAVEEAIKALSGVWPHGRDYQSGDLRKAMHEHGERSRALRQVAIDLQVIADGIASQL
jgi:hypothetical protein